MRYLKCFLIIAVLAEVSGDDCLPRDYGHNGTVCVCNKDHCDTVESFTPKKGTVIVYTSNRAGWRMKKETYTLDSNHEANESVVTIGSQTYQSVLGFGGAFSDSTGINILSLDKNLQEKLLRSYFSEDGLEYNLCRVPIGCSDFSTHAYSYHDDVEDATLSKFKLQKEDFIYKISMIRRAAEYNKNLRLFAVAWAAPKWMKINDLFGGPMGLLKEKYYQSWAEYHLKFLEAYEKENVSFWGISTGNEPYTGFGITPLPSVAWTSSLQRTWIKENFGPTIRNSSFSHIKIMVLDDQRLHLPGFLETLFESKEVFEHVDGTAFHWYANSIISPDVLTETHNTYPDKFILSSEASLGCIPFMDHVLLGSWNRAEEYAADIIEDMNHYVSGWVDWNMVLDEQGGPTYIDNYLDASIIVNATGGEFYKQPSFYAVGHFSKFVPRDSLRLNFTTNDEEVSVTAFRRPDNGTVVVILNRQDSGRNITVLTQMKKNINLHLTEHSITTILYW